MHPSAAFLFARVSQEYALWRAVPETKRSDVPAWWWAPALAVRADETPMPPQIAASFALPGDATYADAARLMLAALGQQTRQPWPEDFPETYSARIEDPAASAEPAAQAASAAVIPIA